MMFGLTQNKELHRKRYCRRYLIVKMVALVRHMLQFISLHDVMDGILADNLRVADLTVEKLWEYAKCSRRHGCDWRHRRCAYPPHRLPERECEPAHDHFRAGAWRIVEAES